jgi:hypothetical protein
VLWSSALSWFQEHLQWPDKYTNGRELKKGRRWTLVHTFLFVLFFHLFRKMEGVLYASTIRYRITEKWHEPCIFLMYDTVITPFIVTHTVQWGVCTIYVQRNSEEGLLYRKLIFLMDHCKVGSIHRVISHHMLTNVIGTRAPARSCGPSPHSHFFLSCMEACRSITAGDRRIDCSVYSNLAVKWNSWKFVQKQTNAFEMVKGLVAIQKF